MLFYFQKKVHKIFGTLKKVLQFYSVIKNTKRMINPATNPRIAIKTICKQLHDIFIQDESEDMEVILPKMYKLIEFYGLTFKEEDEEPEIRDAKLQWEDEINSVLCFKNFEYFRGVCEHFINFDKIWDANRNYLLNNYKNG